MCPTFLVINNLATCLCVSVNHALQEFVYYDKQIVGNIPNGEDVNQLCKRSGREVAWGICPLMKQCLLCNVEDNMTDVESEIVLLMCAFSCSSISHFSDSSVSNAVILFTCLLKFLYTLILLCCYFGVGGNI